MKRSLGSVLFAGALAAGAAHAQTTTPTTTQILQTQNVVSPVTQVQGLAPQVVPFVGGDTNFQNLVNGFAFGLPVTLSTPVAPGVTQLVTFTPVGTLTPQQIAQTLEQARQVGITNGITSPTAVQLSSILTGGTLPTAIGGTTPVPGLVGGTAVSTAVATSNTTVSPAAAMQQGQSFNTSDSPFPRGVSDTVTTTPTTRLDTTGTRIIPGTTAPATTSATGTTGTPGAAAAGATTPRFGIAPR
jgi:hypothetical protein